MTNKEKTEILKKLADLTTRVNKAKPEPKPVQKYMTVEEKAEILKQIKDLVGVINNLSVK